MLRRLTFTQWVLLLLTLIPVFMLVQFVRAYAYNIPFFDDAYRSMDVAFRTMDGSLRLEHITTPLHAHLPWTTYGLVSLLSKLDTWQPIHMMYISVGIVTLQLLLTPMLAAPQHRRYVWYAIVPVALLTHALQQNLNWLSAFMVAWTLPMLFAVIAFWGLRTGTLLGIVAAGVVSLLGAVTIGTTLALPLLITVILWAFGYRWRGYAVWGVFLVATLAIHLLLTAPGDSGERFLVLLLRPHWFITFMLTYLGSLFAEVYNHNFVWTLGLNATQGYGVALFAGVVIAVSGIINLAYILRQGERIKPLMGWLGYGLYGLAVGALIYAGRNNGLTTLYPLPLHDYYTAQSVPAVAAWVFVVALGTGIALQNTQPHARQLTRFNIIVSVVLALLFIRGQAFFLQNTARVYERDITTTTPHIAEICVTEYPFSRNLDCLGGNVWLSPGDIYRMGIYDMGVFYHQATGSLAPDGYRPGDALILETHDAWLNVYLRAKHLEGVLLDDVLHLAPAVPESLPVVSEVSIDSLNNPLQNWIQSIETEQDTLADFLSSYDTVWYVTNETQTLPNRDAIAALGYRQTTQTPINRPPYSGNLVAVRYKALPTDTTPQATFDDRLQLVAYDIAPLAGDCPIYALTTWWQQVGTVDDAYALRWALQDNTGETVSFAMAGFSELPTNQWETGRLYLDERQMALPCDVGSDVEFVLSIENADRSVRLSVTESAPATTTDNFLILGNP